MCRHCRGGCLNAECASRAVCTTKFVRGQHAMGALNAECTSTMQYRAGGTITEAQGWAGVTIDKTMHKYRLYVEYHLENACLKVGIVCLKVEKWGNKIKKALQCRI